jgi:hypothetical protein
MTGASHPARFPAPADGSLTPAMQAAFARDGYLVLESYVDPASCDALRERAEVLVAAFDPAGETTVFSTKTRAHSADDYFRGSGDKVRLFFEEDAIGEDGDVTVEKSRAINKIGHNRFRVPGNWHARRRILASWNRCCCSRCTSSSSRGSAARCCATRTAPSC